MSAKFASGDNFLSRGCLPYLYALIHCGGLLGITVVVSERKLCLHDPRGYRLGKSEGTKTRSLWPNT